MSETNHEEYKRQVEELGKHLLDVISSVSNGDYNVDVNIPEDNEIFADLAVGLEFLIEDLRESNGNPMVHPPQTLPAAEPDPEMPSSQLRASRPHGRSVFDREENGLTLSRDAGIRPEATRLSNMKTALEKKAPAVEANGNNLQTLSLPIPLQDEVIGVIGFNRSTDQPWTAQEIATVETITEQLGLALENQRLFEQTEKALAETELLYQATAELNTAQNYTEILEVLRNYSTIAGKADAIRILIETQITLEDGEEITTMATLAQIPELSGEMRYQQAQSLQATLGFQEGGACPPRTNFGNQ